MNVVAGAVIANELRRDDDDNDADDDDDSSGLGDLADELTAAAVDSLAGSTGLLGGGAFRSGNAIFGAIINAVQRDNDSNILSTPSIMTRSEQHPSELQSLMRNSYAVFC